MNRKEIRTERLHWIDITNPSPEELSELAKEFNLHPLFVADCLDPEHLPKIEKTDDGVYFLVRTYDVAASEQAASVQELTRKIAIFYRENEILTIHRAEIPLIDSTMSTAERLKISSLRALLIMFKSIALSYERPLEAAEEKLFVHELSQQKGLSPSDLLKVHHLRRQLSTLKRLFWHLKSVYQQIPVDPRRESARWMTDLQETTESILFFVDELLEDTTNLLTLEISMSSSRTNEVIRVLTIFSAFFLPLTFIVGVYGMNFRYMPELTWKYGYPFAWGVILLVTVFIFIAFKRKKWL